MRNTYRFVTLILILLTSGTTAAADTGKPKASILIVDSHAAIAKWVLAPGDGDIGRLRKVALGKKIYTPIVVTGLNTTEFGRPGIVADMEFVAPDGKVLHSIKKCCGSNRGDPRTPGLVVLNPVLDYESEPGDPLGRYELRATVTYNGDTFTARESFEVTASSTTAAEPPAVVGISSKAPTQKPARPSRAHLDARECLNFADNLGVARCAEKFR
jgi:hypothetical protein